MKMSMINQTESKAEPVTPAAPFVPADMPRDKADNIAYESCNFFQSSAHVRNRVAGTDAECVGVDELWGVKRQSIRRIMELKQYFV